MGEYVRHIQRVQRQYHAKLANDLKAAEAEIERWKGIAALHEELREGCLRQNAEQRQEIEKLKARLPQRVYIYEGAGRVRLERCERCGTSVSDGNPLGEDASAAEGQSPASAVPEGQTPSLTSPLALEGRE